jgi:hypothetical protein
MIVETRNISRWARFHSTQNETQLGRPSPSFILSLADGKGKKKFHSVNYIVIMKIILKNVSARFMACYDAIATNQQQSEGAMVNK